MKIGLYEVGAEDKETSIVRAYMGSLCADIAKHTMPGVEVCHLTDNKALSIPGTTAIRMERNCPMAVFRMRHHQAPGDWLFIDSDVFVVKDVQDVFTDAFDIAIAKRNNNDGTDHAGFTEMPHNMGVVFSRSPAFWKAIEDELLTYAPDLQDWMGDQLAVCRLMSRFNTKVLPGTYNFAPNHPHFRGDASILHFKGKRKRYMRIVADDILETA